MRLRRSQRGFTMLEILVVVAIIGTLAAIAIWNYWLSIQRAKQRRTMADIRTIATAWESRAADVHGYNAAAAYAWPSQPVTSAELQEMLAPTYVRTFPVKDGWGNPFDFGSDQPVGGGERAEVYAVRSPGKDGMIEGSYPLTVTRYFDCDIIYSNGAFVVAPSEEAQKE